MLDILMQSSRHYSRIAVVAGDEMCWQRANEDFDDILSRLKK